MKTKTKAPFTTLLDAETQKMLETLAENQATNKATIVRSAIRYHYGMMRAHGGPIAGGQNFMLNTPQLPTIGDPNNDPAA